MLPLWRSKYTLEVMDLPRSVAKTSVTRKVMGLCLLTTCSFAGGAATKDGESRSGTVRIWHCVLRECFWFGVE